MSPHLQLLGSVLHPLLAATSSGKSSTQSSGGSYGLLIIIALFALVYFLFIRPRGQRMRAQQAEAKKADVGDEVMLTSGIIGTVTWLEDNRARVEVAPGTELLVDKNAILRKLEDNIPGATLSDEDIAAHHDEDDHVAGSVYDEPPASPSAPPTVPPEAGPSTGGGSSSSSGSTGLGDTGLGDMGTGPSAGNGS